MLRKEEYVMMVRRPYPPLLASLVLHGWSDHRRFDPFLPEHYAMKDALICGGTWYYGKRDLERGEKIIFLHWSNPVNLNEGKRLLLQKEKELLRAVKKDFTTFCDAFELYMPAMHLAYLPERLITEKIRYLLQAKLPLMEIEQLLNDLNAPLQDNYYKKEEYELVTSTDIAKHVKKYEWINSRYGEKHPYTIEQAQQKLSGINKVAFLKKWKEEKEHLKKKIAHAKNILGKKDAHYIDFMQFIIFYRTHRTDTLAKAFYYYIPALERLAKTKRITYQELLYCTKEELLHHVPSPQILAERMNDCTILLENGQLRIVSGKESAEIYELLREKQTNTLELKGTNACRGNVTGTAKIVLDTQDFHKIKEGDILVTSMTTPNMIPIMKKASAFVTDEGGITCHAAIIAREMKKPCIIGTKYATKIFKDGNMVEVNAEKGIVRKIR